MRKESSTQDWILSEVQTSGAVSLWEKHHHGSEEDSDLSFLREEETQRLRRILGASMRKEVCA